MTQHYLKFRFLPLFFCALLFFAPLFVPAANADDVAAILPQFSAFNPPHAIVDLKFQDKDGKPHQLSDYYGKLILVNLWATWCIPCRRELPALDHLQTVYKSTGFRILTISLDDPSDENKIIEFYQAKNIQSLPVFWNPEFSLLKQLHPNGLPTSYLITPDGKAVGMVEGIANWDGIEASNLIEAYLPPEKNSTKKK